MGRIDAKNFTIVQGTATYVNWNLTDDAGVAVDMTDGNKTLYAALKQRGGTQTYSRLSTTSTHNNYTATGRSQAGGKGQWTYGADETFVAGKYIVDYYLKDTADTIGTPRKVGSAVVTIVASETTVP